MINTSVNLGQCKVSIAAEIKKSEIEKVLQKGIEKLAYHASASKVFGPKAHDRDESFSDNLASDLRKGLNLVISPFCDSLTFEITARPAAAKKLTVADVLAGLTEEDLTKLLAEKQAAKVEASEEVVSMG